MTPSSLNNLTDAEINERIAVALGVKITETWYGFKQKGFGQENHCLFNSSPNDRTYADEQRAECIAAGWECSEVFGEEWPTHFPNYCHSLDAMAEAEATLDAWQQDLFARQLSIVMGLGYVHEHGIRIDTTTKILFASARQRAEAFLATIAP